MPRCNGALQRAALQRRLRRRFVRFLLKRRGSLAKGYSIARIKVWGFAPRLNLALDVRRFTNSMLCYSISFDSSISFVSLGPLTFANAPRYPTL
jgi:hypothetical protein